MARIDAADAARSRRFGYDGQGRLIFEARGDGTPEGTDTVGYAYDAVGNRLSREDGTRSRDYVYAPDANRLDETGRQDLSYDARGNLLEDRGGRRGFAYDATNRMSAYYKNGELKAEYDYDAHGRRIRKRLARADGDGTKSLRYVYDLEGRLLSETARRDDRRALRAKDLVWLGSVAIAQVERRVKADGTTRKADVLSLHADHLGAPREARGTDGTVVWRWDGDAFGAAMGGMRAVDRDPDGDGTRTEVALRFPGQYHDRESGLFYNHHRDYDPKLGRYVQSDPIGLQGGMNRYAYVGGDPVNYVDPTGLDRWICSGTRIYDHTHRKWISGSFVKGQCRSVGGTLGGGNVHIPGGSGSGGVPFADADGNVIISDFRTKNNTDTCLRVGTPRGDITVPPGYSAIRMGGSHLPAYLSNPSGDPVMSAEWALATNSAANDFVNNNNFATIVLRIGTGLGSAGIAIAGMSSAGAVVGGSAVAISGTTVGIVSLPVAVATTMTAVAGGVNAEGVDTVCPINSDFTGI